MAMDFPFFSVYSLKSNLFGGNVALYHARPLCQKRLAAIATNEFNTTSRARFFLSQSVQNIFPSLMSLGKIVCLRRRVD